MAIIPPVTRISSQVVRILGCNPGPFTLQGTNTYLIGKGKRRVLLDTGDPNVPEYINNLKKVIQDENAQLSDIIISHWHHDHIGGVKNIFENFKLNSIRSLLDECNVWKFPSSNESDFLEYLGNDIKLKPLKDGQKFVFDEVTLKVVHTPGHTADHVVLFFEQENAIFSGDCVLGEGTAVFEDLFDYMISLDKILSLNSNIIYPGHGNIVNDAKEKIQFYIDHRMQRENEILQLLKNDPGREFSIEEIVKNLYEDVHENLWLAAGRNVKLHLKKLVKESKVERLSDDKWKYNKIVSAL